jgi:hypothetical protein
MNSIGNARSREAVVVEFIKINGQAVRLTRFYRRTVEGGQGVALDEIELVVMLRGRTVQRSFQDLLRAPRFLIEIPGADSLQMVLGSASLQTSGTGEAAIHRYDIVFREVPESAALRSAERKNEAVTPAKIIPVQAPAADDGDEDDDGTVDLGRNRPSPGQRRFGNRPNPDRPRARRFLKIH